MKNILLVEDDPHVRPFMEHVLLDAGYGVDAAIGVAQARTLLANGGYDLVLTDGKLPDGSGIEIADDAKRRGIMVVLITGLALTYSKDELEYLIKPVRPYELLLTVRRYIGD
jgi:DNA-binding response OmpR family regulator